MSKKGTKYSLLAKLFAAVRDHELEKGACFNAWASPDGALVGFCTADTKERATYWVIPRKALKVALRASTNEDEQEWHRQMLSYQGRRELVPWIRGEEVSVKKKPAKKPEPSPPPPEPAPESEPEAEPELSDHDVFNLLMEQDD